MNLDLKIELFALSLLLITSCKDVQKEYIKPEIWQVDVSKEYPMKFIKLEDIADIEYICPETHDDYLYRDAPNYVTDEYLIFYNRTSGDVLTFDRKGIPVSKFNHKGNGPGEYAMIIDLFYDTNNSEYYILYFNKIFVYSKEGEYKRALPLGEDIYIFKMLDFDDKTILCYDEYAGISNSFFFVSKEDGHVIEEVMIPFEEKLDLNITWQDGEVFLTVKPHRLEKCNMVHHAEGVLLTDHSNDSVYLYRPDGTFSPVLFRTPPIGTMDPMIYLNGFLETEDYIFMSSVKREYDWNTHEGLPKTYIMMNKHTGEINQNIAFSDDFKGREFVISHNMLLTTNRGNLGVTTLPLEVLKMCLEKGLLAGELEKLVAALDEDANDVIVLLHFK